MNLSIVRTTESGKESLNIKDASESIAYAILRRFLPEQKDMLTPDPVKLKVQEAKAQGLLPDDVKPFHAPKEDNHEKLSNLPNFLTSDTAGVLTIPIEANTTTESVKTFIKAAQEKARKELQDELSKVDIKLQDKPAEELETRAEGNAIYKEPTVIRKGGKELYTVKVHCDACGHKGSRLSTIPGFYVKCRNCDNKLVVDQMYTTPFMANSEGYAFKAETTFIPSDNQKALRKEMEVAE